MSQVETLIAQGCECCEREDYRGAIAVFDQALKIDRACAIAWNYRGNALSALKRYAEALDHYDRATFLQPNYHQAWFNRGLLLVEMGAYGTAIASYDQAIDCVADPVYVHARSTVGLRRKLIAM